jgi:glycosyltransferase involved in cell wall biosynthesis
MKVHIVCYEDVHGWILGKFALKLQENLRPLGVAASISKQPDPQADINHHIIYYDYDGRKTTTDTVMVTHIDTDWKRERLRHQLGNAAMGICMSAETVDNLTAAGLPREKLCFVNPGHDGEMRARRTIIGITSKVQPSGCKREGILLELAQRISPDEFQFCIMGAGWEEQVKTLRLAGFTVDHWNAFDRNEYLKLMPSLDYYLYLGMDEGSMGYMDALAAGVPTIVTTQGYHLDAPGGITHGWSQPDELIRIFEGISREKRLRQQAVANWTWPEYAKRHLAIWTYLLAQKSGQAIPAALRGVLNKVAVRPTGVTFSENAIGLTAAPPPITHSSAASAVSGPTAQRPRVMLMADVPNWIFERHCKVLMEKLGFKFQFDLKYKGQSYDEEDYDLLYPLEWSLIPSDQIRTPEKYITSIRSHTSWAGTDFSKFTRYLNVNFQQIHTVSKRLYKTFSPFVQKTRYVTHGTDTTFFTPTRRVDQPNGDKIRIGWAGNRVNKNKGFDEIIAPIGQLPGVELVFCGYIDKNLDLDGMRQFYDSIDIYICSSALEGNNNSLLEAASMERAIITTDNGTVPEYLENRVSALVVERNLSHFINSAIELRDNPKLRRLLGVRARQAVVAKFDWSKMIFEYEVFFTESLLNIKKRSAVFDCRTVENQSQVDEFSLKNEFKLNISRVSECLLKRQKILEIAQSKDVQIKPEEMVPIASVTDPDSAVKMAIIAKNKGDADGFESAVNLALSLSKNHRSTRRLIADTFLEVGNIGKAAPIYHALAVEDESDQESLLGLGQCLIDGLEFESAIDIYNKVLIADPENKIAKANLIKAQSRVVVGDNVIQLNKGIRPLLRIVYLISNIQGVTGGNQTLLRQVNELAARGHVVSVVTYTPPPSWIELNARVIIVPRNCYLAEHVPSTDIVVATYFSNAVELPNINAIVKIYYAQGDQYVFEDSDIRGNSSTGGVASLHELSRISYQQPGMRFIANSNNLARAVFRRYGRKADAVLPVCTDQHVFYPLNERRTAPPWRILVVGPDTRGSLNEPLMFKGISDIKDAIQIVGKHRQDFEVVRMSNSRPELFADMPCEFHTAPPEAEKTRLYGTAHILIYASHYDSCPRPPQEAMAAGVVVICTDTDGAREYCRDGVNCILVPVRNPEAIADALNRVLDDSALRDRLVQGGFSTAAEFPSEREWSEWEGLLRRFYRDGLVHAASTRRILESMI